MNELPLWLQILTLVVVPVVISFAANSGMFRSRSAQAQLDEASAAEIVQRLAKKELAGMIRRLKALELSDEKKTKKINALERELVDERGKRRELERGIGVLVNQLTAAGLKPKWVPQSLKR